AQCGGRTQPVRPPEHRSPPLRCVSVAIGFEKLTWITSQDKYLATGSHLDELLRAHSFSPGTAYADHVSTDKSAEYGIAALVATALGVKVIKPKAAAGLGARLAQFFHALFAAVAR